MVTKMLLKKITLLVSTMLIFVFFSSMKCTRNEVPIVSFGIENKSDDSIRIEYVSHLYGYQNFTLPFTDNFSNESCFIKDIYSTRWNTENGIEDVNDISWNEAMQMLEDNIDSVKIIRLEDGKSISYSHAENASEQEKFLFRQEAWITRNENYNTSEQLVSRDYVFIITRELFDR